MLLHLIDCLLLSLLIGLSSSSILCWVQLSSFLVAYWRVFVLILEKLSAGKIRLVVFDSLEEMIIGLHMKSPFLADLLSCPYCLAAWVCLILSITAALSFNLTILSTVLVWLFSSYVAVVGRKLAERFEK